MTREEIIVAEAFGFWEIEQDDAFRRMIDKTSRRATGIPLSVCELEHVAAGHGDANKAPAPRGGIKG
ncbi:MAG: hypothetical protein IJ803_08865 [Oribacterium sp.]|nr:hypothetical protein [Oribacterium sp.]